MGVIGSLPTLYKKTSKGAIEQWSIWVECPDDQTLQDGDDEVCEIVTEYGHVGGKLQTAHETVSEGKNLGKANETTPREQALAQAKAEWETKKSRKGYVENIDDAQAGKNSGAGGIRPMLAKPFEDVQKKWAFPCYAQPKLDGIRCIAVVEESGEVTLWSREQKPIVAVPRIANAVAVLNLPAGTVLDGELYNHDLKDDFETIVSCVRGKGEASAEEQAMIEYHVYDLPRHPGLPGGAHFGDRTTLLALITAKAQSAIKYVETVMAKTPEELEAHRVRFVDAGYEGGMARALEKYDEGKRSSSLAKLKVFIEKEFEIVGVYEGKGKMEGLAMFACSMEPGHRKLSREECQALAKKNWAGTKLFGCKLEGKLENLGKYLTDESTWWDHAAGRGKPLTVKYFTLTRKRQVPRFPVGKAVRDYE